MARFESTDRIADRTDGEIGHFKSQLTVAGLKGSEAVALANNPETMAKWVKVAKELLDELKWGPTTYYQTAEGWVELEPGLRVQRIFPFHKCSVEACLILHVSGPDVWGEVHLHDASWVKLTENVQVQRGRYGPHVIGARTLAATD